MKVSIICCTEDRHEFIPWLAFVYESLRLPEGYEKELVVVDSTLNSEEVYALLERLIPGNQLRYTYLPHGTPLGEKRNMGMDMSDGELIAWLDDDDAKAPGWLEWAIETLGELDILAVKTKVMFLNIVMEPMKARWVPTKWYSAGLYSRRVAEEVRFKDATPIGEDTAWQGYAWARLPAKRQVHILQEGTGLALTHYRNIANRFAKPARWKHAPGKPEMWTPDEWDLCLEEIQKLRKRLGYVK